MFGLTNPPRHPERQAQAVQAVRRASNEFDPQLLKPVCLAPLPPISAAERARLTSELGCLKRELCATRRGIAALTKQLAA